MIREHVCDPTINPCACGRAWEFYRVFHGKRLYTSRVVRDRYHALYGAPDLTFMPADDP